MSIIINPGSGPVEDATREQAEANIRAFLVDLGLPGVVRATFVADVEQVRYLDGDPWPFPRLYVDGDSWLWKWALSNARRALGQEEAEDGE